MSETWETWIDISVPTRTGMVIWPNDPPFQISRIHDMEQGAVANVSQVAMGLHTGTHIDAPLHFIRDGKTIVEMPIAAGVGRARVIELHDPESIKPAELEPHRIQPGERLLFKTRNSLHAWQSETFVEHFVSISKEAAYYLAECQIQTVGIDYLSVGGYFKDGVETHQALLGAGIWLIEGLNLAQVSPGDYELICLPLKIVEGEAAPARAVLRRSS